MSESEPTPELNKALAAFQSRLPRIGKGETGTVSGKTKDGRAYSYTYKYADLSDISPIVMELLGAEGLAWSCRPTMLDGRFVLAYDLRHQSGQQIGGIYPLVGAGGPQDLGKEITYARRYALCAVTGIAPGDDDDDGAAAQKAYRRRPAEDEHPQNHREEMSEDDPRVALRGRMGWLIKQIGLTAEDALRAVSEHAGREVKNSRELTAEELTRINEALEQMLTPTQDKAEAPVDEATGEVHQQITDKTQRRQRAQRKELGLEDDGPFWEWLEVQFGRPFTSSKEQTEAEALDACRRMQIMVDAARRQEEGAGNGYDDGS
jgi:hypothetical protein